MKGLAAMHLLAVYVGLLTIGEFGAYLLGREIERFSPAWSLPIFLALFFFMFWAMWRVAVRVTEPSHGPKAGSIGTR
jgi:hypothetical protein